MCVRGIVFNFMIAIIALLSTTFMLYRVAAEVGGGGNCMRCRVIARNRGNSIGPIDGRREMYTYYIVV